MTQIIPTAEPFLFPGNRTGCLLIHGFTGAPKEMRWMGEALAGKGYSVLGLRLTGHATRPDDMRRSNWSDWTSSVEDAYHLLRGCADRIYLVGLSMGGILALLMSTRLDVKGVVAISTPYQLVNDWRLKFVDWVNWLHLYMPKSNEPPGSGWFDQAAFSSHVSYDANPVRSIGQLNRLLAEMRRALPEVRVPVLLIHSRDDHTVPTNDMEQIYSALVNAPVRNKLYLTGSGHVVTRDAARLQAFDAAIEFISRQESRVP